MLRISSGTWKFIRPAPWVSPAMVSPPWNGGPSEPIPADPGRSAAAWKERGIVPKRSTVARHCGPDRGRAALALGSLALAAAPTPIRGGAGGRALDEGAAAISDAAQHVVEETCAHLTFDLEADWQNRSRR